MSHKDQGFTLLETLVALAILSLALVALFRTVSDGLGGVRRTDEHVRAVAIAQSLLERAGADQKLDEGIVTGAAESLFRWTIRTTAYAVPKNRPGSPVLAGFWVTATVSWNARGGTPSVSLTTLKLRPLP